MSYQSIKPAEAKALVDDGWTYVDVRTVEEFERGHPEGAYNVPFAFMEMGRMTPNPDFVNVLTKHFAPDTKLVLGCASGNRSMYACEALTGEGFQNLANMLGGFGGARDPHGDIQEEGWASLGLPTATDPQPDRTYDRLSS